MDVKLRLPDIKGTEVEQLKQIRSYLYQLIPQLQFALDNVSANSEEITATPKSLLPARTNPYAVSSLSDDGEDTAQATFNSIKSLIIKSADIVEAYYEEINKKLESVYVAQSDFGDFAERTSQEIEETSTSTTQRFENIQIIISNHDDDIASIEGDLQSIGQDLSYTQKEILTLNSTIDTIDNYVATVEGEVFELDTTLKATKTELQGKVESAKSELSGSINSTKTDVNGRIDDTNGSVAGLGEGLNDANNRIADVDQDLQDAKAVINDGIQGVHDRVTGVNALLEDAKAQLRGSIDDLEIYITGLKDVIIGVTAYLKSGLLYYTDAGVPVYGLEVGQTVKDEVAGTEVFNKYARFTSEKLSFYDSNGIEVAYISDKKLYIKMAEITVSFKIGGLISLVMTNGDVVEKWVGG